MSDEKDIDISDVEQMDELAETLAGSLIDTIYSDNEVDPLSADYENENEEN